MNPKINLGKVDSNTFKESKAAAIAKLRLEESERIKTHFTEMDKTPNFDGKLMIIEERFERISVEVQIKSLPRNTTKNPAGEIKFLCDTKAMNCVLKNVTFSPVVLLAVDLRSFEVYYKVLTREYVSSLKIGTKKKKTIVVTQDDLFQADRFLRDIYHQVAITETDVDCITQCGIIRDSIRNAEHMSNHAFQLVYQRGNVQGFFSAYTQGVYDDNKPLILSKIKMISGEITEELCFQCDKDYIHINRVPDEAATITDADILNIILEVAKESKKPILFTSLGKPLFWISYPCLWQLRAEEITLDWYLRA